MISTETSKSEQNPSHIPSREILDYMERQAALFEQMKSDLLEQYCNQFVWFEDGKVLDADKNHEVLVLRVYGEGAPRPLFVKKVVPIEPKLCIRSPFLSAT
ncbi:MAG: hypothetical protein VKJ24_18840 [Synechococcales bacterium]|nr:hypothetical protein [Synechococcales bacterium]